MLEILQFVFSSFWHWAGTVILIGAVAAPFAAIAGVFAETRGPQQ